MTDTEGLSADYWEQSHLDSLLDKYPEIHRSFFENERITVWSRHALEPLDTSDGERTAAARVRPALGDPFVVFGTVLP